MRTYVQLDPFADMKRILYLIVTCVVIFSCSSYDDTWIRQELDSQKEAVSDLESFCRRFNSNINSLKEILVSLQENDYLKSVNPIMENGIIEGYELVFMKRIVRLYSGTDGEPGAEGKDARAPGLSVRKDSDGKWYWTIDGDWCRDSKGNKVPAIDNSAVTPLIEADDGFWFISYDEGHTWHEAGPAEGADGDLMFAGIDTDDSYLYLTMSDGNVLRIPLASDLSIEFGELPSEIGPDTTFSIDYRIIGGKGDVELSYIGEHGWSARISPSSETDGRIFITSPSTLKAGKIIVIATEDEMSVMKAITFDGDIDQAHYISSQHRYHEVDGTGGYVDILITTNQEYTIGIPEEATSWIRHVSTRSVRQDRIRLGISGNGPGLPAREARISIKGEYDSVDVLIYQKGCPFIESEIDPDKIDGFDDPENGITILQKATKGNGTDIVLMGDGFVEKHFLSGGSYETIMKQAYKDLFSVEPFASLKDYFNVYYINVLSEDEHDAEPYYDYFGNQNGAVQGNADTRLGTKFTAGSTSIDGDSEIIMEYATHAIEMKGASDGGNCTHSEAYNRAQKSLIIVMANVECYAGTCLITWRNSTMEDYASSYSIAYCSLGSDGTGRQCKYTLIHEAGGHGFGKLADEYSGISLTQFSISEWNNLRSYHSFGVFRNVNEYWTEAESKSWSGITWDYTTEDNVYWSELLDESAGYVSSESLGIFKGAYTYSSMFCRPSSNSMMNNQLRANGQYFNAISRWAIWYRVMKLSGSISAGNFKASLDDFIEFDKTLTITKNNAVANTQGPAEQDVFSPLGPPMLMEIE